MSSLISATQIGMTFGDGALATPVLHGVDLQLRPGELTLLTGPSGSGKTTLVSIVAGLLRPRSGTVDICGHRITGMSEGEVARVRRQHVGFVFQTDNLFPALTALQNVAEVLRLRGMPKTEALGRARAALERVGLHHRLDHRPGELSGGQRQRVAVARALAGHPSLVIGDEITSALDGATAVQVMELVRDYITPHTAALIVTHDHRLERFADRIVAMEDGRVVSDQLVSRAMS
jgi:putative ABC transport system ATP-binding protein